MPSFLYSNIDRAIVATQYDLRGFWHPLGFRMPKESAKSLHATTTNFMNFAAGCAKEDSSGPTDENYVRWHKCTHEEYLAMCKRLVNDCDLSEKEAIQLIIKDIAEQMEGLRAKKERGETNSGYVMTMDKDNRWGMVILALAEAFEVSLETVTT